MLTIKNWNKLLGETFRDGRFPIDEVLPQFDSWLGILAAQYVYVLPTSVNAEIQKELGVNDLGAYLNGVIKQIPHAIGPGINPGIAGVYYNKEDLIQYVLSQFRTQVETFVSSRVINSAVIYNDIVKSSLDTLSNVVQTQQTDITYSLPTIQRVILDPKAPPPGPTAIEQVPTGSVNTGGTNTGVVITTPNIYSYELTNCTDSTIKITGTSLTPIYGPQAFVYNGVCYSISSTQISTTFAYLATGISLDSLPNYPSGCGACIQALTTNPQTTPLAFVVQPYIDPLTLLPDGFRLKAALSKD